MTNLPDDSASPDRHKQAPIVSNSNRHYRLTNAEWIVNSKRFRPAEVKVLYYLRTINPFDDNWIDIVVTRLAEELGIDKGTVSRALKRLACAGEIDLEIQTARVRLISRAQVLSPRNALRGDNTLSTDRDRCVETTSTIATQHLNDHSDLKAPLGKGSKNSNVPNKERLVQTKQTGRKPPSHPVPTDSLRSAISEGSVEAVNPYGEHITALLALVREARVNPNKTITQTILETLQRQGSAAGARAVENAISALKEAQDKRYVKNAGGFLVAALRENFTANGAKKKARERSLSPSETLPGEPPSPLPADLSGTIALITCELERLDWSKNQAIAHMMKQHHWRRRTFSQLTDADLIKLLSELQGVQ